MPDPDRPLIGNRDLHTGPAATRQLPPVLPAGQLPPENSNMWLFTPKSVQQGERFIQDDTRQWFAERNFLVPVQRHYRDHPRWLVAGETSRRAAISNGNITSEIHMLIRLHNGLPEYPEWVNARMAIKVQQADLAYKLTKATRDTWLKHGKQALEDFAQRAPAQFVKFVATTFVPKKVEVEQVSDGSGLDSEERGMLLKALADELKRRQDQALVDGTVTVLDYEPQNDLVETMNDLGEQLRVAAAIEPGQHLMDTGNTQPKGAVAANLKRVENVIDHVETERSIAFAEGTGPAGMFDWDE